MQNYEVESGIQKIIMCSKKNLKNQVKLISNAVYKIEII